MYKESNAEAVDATSHLSESEREGALLKMGARWVTSPTWKVTTLVLGDQTLAVCDNRFIYWSEDSDFDAVMTEGTPD
jgi:hypothetical protein